jgi:antitoxin component YwqK of YwqJK toxin-antitoxin module
LKNWIFILFVFSAQVGFSQYYKPEILKKFDSVDYYPNSIIKCAYTKKHKTLNGYAIEFNETGQVTAIGKYKHGKKDGAWTSGQFCTYYKKGKDSGIIAFPGCGTGVTKAKRDFVELYYELIGVPMPDEKGIKNSFRDL